MLQEAADSADGVEDLKCSLETHPEHEEGSELSGKRETDT